MRTVLCSAFLASLLTLMGCGGSDSEVDRSGLEQAQGEVERQEERQSAAQAQLRAARKQTRVDDALDPSRGSLASQFETYTSTAGGWSADVPVSEGWSDGLETEVTPGALYRTEFTGPGGAVLIIDSTPFEAPTFSGAPVQSRATVDHPMFGPTEKIIFKGNSGIEVCESELCVDYLVPYESGGYAVLAGGPGEFSEVEALAERVMRSLRYFDV